MISSQIDERNGMDELCVDSCNVDSSYKPKVKVTNDNPVEFSKVDAGMLPTVLLIG